MAITIPNTACVTTASQSIAAAQARWANLGFTATTGGSGCCMWFSGSSEASGSPFLPIVVPTNGTFQSKLVMVACGFFAGCIVGGSAHIWYKNAS